MEILVQKSKRAVGNIYFGGRSRSTRSGRSLSRRPDKKLSKGIFFGAGSTLWVSCWSKQHLLESYPLTEANTDRFPLIDSIRGFAVLLMVTFHFCFDLRYFGFVEWDVPNGAGWWQFRYLILSLFIGTVGISLSLAHRGKARSAALRSKSFLVRQTKLLVSALAISLMSIFVFPDTWIYFGILHFIFLASLICLPFVLVPRFALLAGLSIILAYILDWINPFWPFTYIGQYLPRYTEDFVPFFPWLGVCLVGVYLGCLITTIQPRYCLKGEAGTAFAGRYALVIYLLHQPILFAGFSTYIWLLR